MRAFWCIRANDNGEPNFPVELQTLIINGDLRISDTVEAHKHCTVGSLAVGSDHYHWFYLWNDTIFTDFVGGGVEHEHTFTLEPTHFLVWVLCTDPQYTALIAAVPNIIILGENEIYIEDEVEIIGAVDNTAWEASERSDWEDLVDNFGVVLPDQVINDRRFVQWALQTWNARGQKMVNERNYRLGSI